MKLLTKEELKKDYRIELWSPAKIEKFRKKLLAWYDDNQRLLPWRENNDPYRIWVSEIMLQQTQVDTVIPYFNHFMEQFPTVADLAAAPTDQVMKAWEGLGYYRRARNLQKAAQQVMTIYEGKIPDHYDELLHLQGIGPYTAGAIASMVFSEKVPAVDGNVLRVVSRLFEISYDIKRAKYFKVFFSVAYYLVDPERPGDFNQALMDLGATIMTPKASMPHLSPVKAFDASYLHETWNDYPVSTKAKAAKVVKKIGLIIKNDEGQYLLEKRPSSGLLANMWTFPLIEKNHLQKNGKGQMQKSFATTDKLSEAQQIELLKRVKKKYGISLQLKNQQPLLVRHVFSHRIWEIQLLEAQVSKGTLTKNSKWIAPKEFSQYVFPTVQTKMIEAYQASAQLSLF